MYANALSNGFVFDDLQQVVQNPYLRRADGLAKFFTTGVWDFLGPVGAGNYYRPLMHSAFWVVFAIAGLNPGAYHIVSILLHAANSMLVFAVLQRFGAARTTAAAAALLFAVHPVHTEAVVWISAYPELLCALFSLLVLWLYPNWIAAGVFLFAALLAKEIAITVPAVLLCYELLARRGARRAWPAFAAMAAAIAIYLAARLHALHGIAPGLPHPLPAGAHAATVLALYARYLWVQLLPLKLHAFYFLSLHRPVWETVAGLTALAATAWLGYGLYRRRRPEALAIPMYLFPLAPAFLLPTASVGLLMAERYTYLPSVGLCWLMGAAFAAAVERWQWRPVAAAFLVVLAIFSLRTVTRNRDWRDELTFYRTSIADFPDFPRSHLNLGEAFLRRGRLDEALAETQAAARLGPEMPEPEVNLGLIYWQQQQPDKAIEHLRRGADLAARHGDRYSNARALANLGVIYRQQGRLVEAEAALRRTIEIEPGFAGAHNNLGYALLQQSRIDDAMVHLRRAAELDPAMDVARANLGLAFAMRGEYDAALAEYRRALELNPRNGEVHARIGEVYSARGVNTAAAEEFRNALRLDPGNERALAGLQKLGNRIQ